MRKTFERNDCGRGGQLIGYLYNESDARERADFERHLHDCAACREELAAFTHVRSSVADFRAELLQTAPPVSLGELAANTNAAPAVTHAPRASDAAHASPRARTESRAPSGFAPPAHAPRASAGAAWAALREVFRLSPAWLRAATVAAGMAVCALALLTVFNAEVTLGGERYALRAGTRPAATPPAGAPAARQSEEFAALQTQLKSMAAERDAAVRELEETREQLDDSRAANLVAAEFEGEPDAPRDPPEGPDDRRQRRAPSAPSKSERPTRGARRLTEDDGLPRLLDLLGDAN
jgi:hypothetical protein